MTPAIIYQDDHVIIVDKSAGIAMHAGPGHDDSHTIAFWLRHTFDRLSNINGPQQPGLVHRLDKDTSGLFVCAKDNATHVNLQQQITAGQFERVYLAWVVGRCKPGIWKDCIGRVGRQKMSVYRPQATNIGIGARPNKLTSDAQADRADRIANRQKDSKVNADRFLKFASMQVEPREVYKDSSIIECKLHTGIQHQIRCQATAHGHPIFGDGLYGRRNNNDKSRKYGMLLHAWRVSFVHPQTQERVDFERRPDWVGDGLGCR